MDFPQLSVVWLIEPASGKIFISPEFSTGLTRMFCVNMSNMCTLYFDEGQLNALKYAIDLTMEAMRRNNRVTKVG